MLSKVFWEEYENMKKNMHLEKKLWLFLDLDHTLLHAHATKYEPSWGNKSFFCISEKEQIYILRTGKSFTYYALKFRPGLKEFLINLSKIYQLYIYTAGTYDYAHAILNILKKYVFNEDESKLFFGIFGGRIITRDHTNGLLSTFFILLA